MLVYVDISPFAEPHKTQRSVAARAATAAQNTVMKKSGVLTGSRSTVSNQRTAYCIINEPENAPRYTFSTQEYLPAAGLYLYQYRVYDPHAGRWTQRDPIDYQDSVNLYQFCGNNPALELDVDGRFVFGRMAALTGHTQMSGAERDYYLAMTEVTRNVEVTAVSTFYVAAATPLVYSTSAAGVVAAKEAITSYMLAGPGVIRVFYSGYPVAYEHAVRYCQSVGNAVTINMTRAGGILTRMQVILGKDMTKPLWRMASAWYANSASGIVPVYLSSTKVTSVSVFYEVEYPILKTIENVQMHFMVTP